MDPDPDPDPLDVLAARDEYKRWRLWRGAGDGDRLVYAWLRNTSPPQLLRDYSVIGLRARMDEYLRVYDETGSMPDALAAAERLET